MYSGTGDCDYAGSASHSASWADESGELSKSHFELGESTDGTDGAGESTLPKYHITSLQHWYQTLPFTPPSQLRGPPSCRSRPPCGAPRAATAAAAAGAVVARAL